jgi:hypothetical protein
MSKAIIKNKSYVLGNKYVLVFIGDGIVKMFESTYIEELNDHCLFDCGIQIRADKSVDTNWLKFFNMNSNSVSEENFEKYMNCALYVFTSKEIAEEIIPKIIKHTLEEIKTEADEILSRYTKLADDCDKMENAIKSIKNHTFEITNPFEK